VWKIFLHIQAGLDYSSGLVCRTQLDSFDARRLLMSVLSWQQQNTVKSNADTSVTYQEMLNGLSGKKQACSVGCCI
jgi:hypothetical protein